MSHKLDTFFKPKSIALVGASKDSRKIGHAALKNILISDYECKIFPINPKENEILGLKTYKSILNVKEKIDLVLICVPAKIVPTIMKECIKKNVKNVIIIVFSTFFLTQSRRTSATKGAGTDINTRSIFPGISLTFL